jgi:hypothetical protein
MESNSQVHKLMAHVKNSSRYGFATRRWRATLIWGLLVLAFVRPAFSDSYRWVDDEGNVHYSDQVPPEEAKRTRSRLDAQGREVAVVEGLKTPEQREREKRLRNLRREQRRLLNEQKDRDLSLLRSFHGAEEMELALQGKLNTIDSAIKITETNKQRQEEILRAQEKRAAEMEVKGQAIPKNLRDIIDQARRQILIYQEKIVGLEKSKEEIKLAFYKDFERYKTLLKLRENPETSDIDWREQGAGGDPGIVSAASCAPILCEKAWALARAYILGHSQKPLVIETEKVLQTAPPLSETDYALLAARIAGKNGDDLFLDVSCHPSSLGDEFCKGPQMMNIRIGFESYIREGLSGVGR